MKENTITAIEAIHALMRGRAVECKRKSNSRWEKYEPHSHLGIVLIGCEYDFRLAPSEFIIIGDVAFPKPETVEPQFDEDYWVVANVSSAVLVHKYSWEGSKADIEVLKRGLLHLSRKNAIAHAIALIKLSGGVIDEEKELE